MNKEEIISSGLLEAYITGDLSVSERNMVEKLLEEDPNVREEFIRIENTLKEMATKYSADPPPAVKDKLLSVIRKETISVDFESRIKYWKYAAAACITIALTASLAAFNYWQKWNNTNEQLAILLDQNKELATNFTKINDDLKDVQLEMSVLVNPDFNKIILDGTENAPQLLAVVYWSADQNKVFFNSASLGELSQDQQYQLWAIKDGIPVDAGVFDPNNGILQPMNNIVAAEAFAVTIEIRGGSLTPTLSTMQVYGKV